MKYISKKDLEAIKLEEDKKVKKLFFRLWNGFPDSRLAEYEVKKVIASQEVIDSLVEGKFLHKTSVEHLVGDWYFLGGNGINLIIAWQTQKLTKIAVRLAFISLLVSLSALITSLAITKI